MTRPTTKAMQDAYALGSFSAQRAELRKLVSPIIMTETSAQDLGGLINTSPICGEVANQMKLRPSWSAFRDALDLDTLAALCMGSIEWTDVSAAIVWPAKNGVEVSGNKTGYAFGRPSKLDKTMVDANNAILMGDAEPVIAKHDPAIFGLQDVISIHDHLQRMCEASTNDVFSAMRKYHTTEEWFDKLTAAQNMIDLRGPVEECEEPYPHLPERCKHCIAEMKLHFDDTAPTPKAEPTATKYTVPSGAESSLIDLALKNAKLPPIATLIDEINGAVCYFHPSLNRCRRMGIDFDYRPLNWKMSRAVTSRPDLNGPGPGPFSF